jgi:hypothetical protein
MTPANSVYGVENLSGIALAKRAVARAAVGFADFKTFRLNPNRH